MGKGVSKLGFPLLTVGEIPDVTLRSERWVILRNEGNEALGRGAYAC